ncbi:MAG: tRNA preQ1(34) S-adenosylmethionine ribosyltransferase-isomerase QueA [Candidatus Sulfotelmatobacter sp.]
MLVSEFHYELPEELIAQEPLANRAASRLLHVGSGDRLEDRQFPDFPELLRPDDLVVFNNTRVFPARLYGRRGGVRAQAVSARNPAARDFLQGRIEVLLTRQVQQEPNEWECLVRPGRKIGVGERLFFGQQDELQAEVIARGSFGERRIRFAPTPPGVARPDGPFDCAQGRLGRLSPHESTGLDDFFGIVERIGHIPLPPYIARPESSGDRERYQTVYARERGSVAAPTAGLHFTPEILTGMRERGIESAEITLHVGLGTFQPVRTQRVEEHQLHSERYSISAEAAENINRARRDSRRIVAVGTTTVRTLEYAALQGTGEIRAASGEADLFIYPGYKFQLVRALLTNFHLPQSTLLMLVCALGGKEKVMRAYEHAVAQRYRFYSYGDCMFVE